MKKLLIGGFLIMALVACAKDQLVTKDVVDLLPADNEISGWTKNSALEIAENQAQLFDLIDGGAETYVNDGFVKCAFQRYAGMISNTPVEAELQIFDMDTTANADKVYHDLTTGSEMPWTGDNPGMEARITWAQFFSYTIEFWEDRFYIIVKVEQDSDPALNIAKLFAFNVSNAIRDTTSTQ